MFALALFILQHAWIIKLLIKRNVHRNVHVSGWNVVSMRIMKCCIMILLIMIRKWEKINCPMHRIARLDVSQCDKQPIHKIISLIS